MVKCELSSGDMIIHVQPVPEDFRNYSTLRSQKQRDLSNSFRVFLKKIHESSTGDFS